MTPFLESEDMTIKRLYVALKRNDIQLLKVGAEKLEEKFHTGYDFKRTEELKEILEYVQFQNVPDNIKTDLVNVLNEILKNEPTPAPVEEAPVEAPKFEVFKTGKSNTAIFYNDKTLVSKYEENKFYRLSPDIGKIAEIKTQADTQIDDINNLLKNFNNNEGEVYFITSSRSENIIKSFIGNYINFYIPNVTEKCENTVALIPLFGLTNLFYCPKCGEREYFGGVHNKVLSLQCKNCLSPMYPDIYETDKFETNSNPYYWMVALNSMVNSNVWVLINPPIEKNLLVEFLKTACKMGKPEKIYIYSKEITGREFYKNAFKNINPDIEIIAENGEL